MSNEFAFNRVSGSGQHASSHLPGGNDPMLLAPPPVTLTDGATIATNAALGSHFRVTLGGNRLLDNPTNMVDGQRLMWEVVQDGSGSRLLTWGSKFTFGSDITTIVLSTAAGKRDFVTAVYNSSTDKLYVVGFARGY